MHPPQTTQDNATTVHHWAAELLERAHHTGRRCFVEQAEGGGRARWMTQGFGGTSFALARSARAVLLGADPPIVITQRAQGVLAELRDDRMDVVHPGGTVISRSGVDIRWWTWAGFRANATLTATLAGLTDEKQRFDDMSIRLRTDLTHDMWQSATTDAAQRVCLPEVDEDALANLKFSEALPHRLAVGALAARIADLDAATTVLNEAARFTISNECRELTPCAEEVPETCSRPVPEAATSYSRYTRHIKKSVTSACYW